APFWQQPEAALGAIREHLARDGAVYIFWDARHSAPERARDLGNELADRLREGGFSVDRVLVEDLRPVPAVCAMGRPQGRHEEHGGALPSSTAIPNACGPSQPPGCRSCGVLPVLTKSGYPLCMESGPPWRDTACAMPQGTSS